MASILEIIEQNKKRLAEGNTSTSQTGDSLLKPAITIKLPVKAGINLPVNANASQSNSHSQLVTSQVETLETKDSDIGPILQKIEELRISLHEVHPNMPNLLHDIWKQLKNTPDCVTLLKPEQMGIIIQALERQTNIKLTEAINKPKGTKKAKLTTDDV